MSERRSIVVHVNTKEYRKDVETRLTLVDFLRHRLLLTGTHVGCEHGVCGACTVLVDGASVRSCLMLAVQAHGRDVQTVEGLASSEQELNILQRAFWELHGLQCGFCTSGMLMTLTEYLRDHPAPSESEIREALSGNICRCTGYQGIVAAALEAAAAMKACSADVKETE